MHFFILDHFPLKFQTSTLFKVMRVLKITQKTEKNLQFFFLNQAVKKPGHNTICIIYLSIM